ncbi:YcbK family protein [Polyangium aurulentum]|uniref:YcbK family protein n=1 Tax=Polyangium aurulentum TaxID=2567896 RepID=UPI0010AE7562|nr:DUF882 domain-containing protein [Polyangium aurulentum]UQA62352.1 DUF882 domain-containing protein [Polyangium aurulentum]
MIRRAAFALIGALAALPAPAPLASEPSPPPPTTSTPAPSAPAPAPTPSIVPVADVPAARPLATIIHSHTLEALPITETEPTMERFSALLADRGFEQSTAMDPKLVELLRTLARKHEGARFEIVSGFRSPKRNELMRKKGRHVASHSQHTLGNAIDFRVEGLSPSRLVAELVALKWPGGIGFYPGRRDRFVHVDTGPKRRWSGH